MSAPAAMMQFSIEYESPLPLVSGSRLPPPPTILTTFAGAGDEGDPSEQILNDRVLRLLREAGTVDPENLLPYVRALRLLRETVEAELTSVQLVEGTEAWNLWLKIGNQHYIASDADRLLTQALLAMDGAIQLAEERMRMWFVPDFLSQLE